MEEQQQKSNVKLGRDLLFDMLHSYHIPYIFGNPGTSELPFIDGAEQDEQVTYISALHEANAVSMAMGYARQAQKPGVAIVHVAPGLANAMGNIYNAHRAHIPLVIIAGQHHSDLLIGEPILAGQHVKQVETMTKWAYEVRHIDEMAIAMQRAFKVAMTKPMGPVFLSIPYNIALTETKDSITKPRLLAQATLVSHDSLEAFISELLRYEKIAVISGDQVGEEQAQDTLQLWAEQLGMPIVVEAMPTRQNANSQHPNFVGTLPMNAKAIRQFYSEYDALIMVGTTVQLPVALSDGKGLLTELNKPLFYICNDMWEIAKNNSGVVALQGSVKALLQELTNLTPQLVEQASLKQSIANRKAQTLARAKAYAEQLKDQALAANSKNHISAVYLANAINERLKLQGERAFTIVNEAVSNALPFMTHIEMWDGHHYTAGKGGGLGHAVGQALGIKLADSERTVICLVGDGTFLYYPQILYSAKTYQIPVLYIIVQNEAYEVLKQGQRAMGSPLGQKQLPSLDLQGAANMMQLVQAFGIEGEVVASKEQLNIALERALKKAQTKPYVLEVVVK